MPGGDGRGPMGMGVRWGRGAGFCAGIAVPGFMNSPFGRGMGCGRGAGRRSYCMGLRKRRGWAGMPFIASDRRDEINVLKDRAKSLGEVLEEMKKRIANLEGKII